MDKLTLLNQVARYARPAASEDIEILSLDTPLADTNLDSLDMLMISIFLGDIYGVSEETLKTFQPVTANDIFSFMDVHKTKEPVSVEEAMASIQ